MLAAFLLGLIGSATHCMGMCSGVMIVLGRGAQGWRRFVLHLGRLTSYALLGALAGSMGSFLFAAGGTAIADHAGHGERMASPSAANGWVLWQGGVALVAALLALYMAVALLGHAPSPERWFPWATRYWGRLARRRVGGSGGMVGLFVAGLLWGVLPCGLVMAALLPAALTGTAGRGALLMVLFGLGTWPLGLGMGFLATTVQYRLSERWRRHLRPLAAGLMLLVGLQMALRGLATWGWVSHGHLGGLMLW